MSSKGGRPKGGEKGDTKQVRLPPDLAEMVKWIGEISGEATATILDRMTRAQIIARFEPLRARVEELKAIQAELDRKLEEARRESRATGDQAPGPESPPKPGPRKRPRKG